MTNREIRALAKQKRGAGGLTLCVFVGMLFSVGISAVDYFIGPKDQVLNYALTMLIFLIVSLVSSAGMAHVSVSAWNGSEARLAEMFSFVTNWRMFGRALAVALIQLAVMAGIQAPTLFTELALRGQVPDFVPLLLYPFALIFIVLSVVTGNLYYAIAAMPNADLHVAIPRGLKMGFRNFWRLIGMSFAVSWQPALVYLGGALAIMLSALFFVGIAGIAGIVVMTIALVALLIAVVLIYGPYISLAFAGLAMEIYSDKPEEK